MKGLFYWIARAWREGPGNRRKADRNAVQLHDKEIEDEEALERSHELVRNSLTQMNDLVAAALRYNAEAEIYRAKLRAAHRSK